MSEGRASDFARIRRRFAEIVGKLEGFEEPPPIPRATDDIATPHVERKGNRWHWVVCERGKEFERKVCNDDDELLYLLTHDVVRDEGWAYELARRVDGQDSRRIAFARMIAQMGRVSPEWQARLKAELDAVLAEHPYHDGAAVTAMEPPRRDWPAYLVILALALLWLAAHYPLYSAWRDSDRLDNAGASANAKVTGKHISYPKSSRTYTIDYAFTLDGADYSGEQGVDGATYDFYDVGDSISISYDPEDPAANRIAIAIDTFSQLATYYVIGDLMILFVVIGGLRKLRRERMAGSR